MYYPMMINLAFFKCLIIGGGHIAYQKAKMLLAYGATVTVLSPEFCEEIKCLEGQMNLLKASYSEDYLLAFQLVIAATNDRACNATIGKACKKQGKLCDVVTDQALSSFLVPAGIRRGDLIISVSTQGKSPALAAKIKEELESLYDESYSDYVACLGKWRATIKKEIKDEEERRRLLKYLITLDQETLKSISLKELSRVL